MTKESIGRYEVQSEIGHGGMASVYLAFDPSFRRNVAIKLVSVNLQQNPIFRERFEREAQLIAKIEHPAIVPVYDFGEQDHQPYLVMRYMPGGALASRIKEGALSLSYTSRLLSQIAPALDAVHAQGIIHRDLKPANILLDGFGNPAISDFGIAHFTQATTDLTGSAVIGTPAYMSPEQVRSDPELDGRSDIYALGVILFEMLTGRGPFRAATPLSAAMKHLTDPIPSVLSFRAELPADVDEILQKAMAKDREMRYESASALATDLQSITQERPQDNQPKVRAMPPTHKEEMVTEIDTGASQSIPAYSLESNRTSNLRPASTATTPSKKSVMPKFAGLAGLGLCLLVVCGSLGLLGMWSNLGLPIFGAEQTQNVESTPTATLPVQPLQKIIFSDDFSDPLSGWPTLQTDRGSYSYQPDGYHIVVNEVESVLWAKTSTEYGDSSIQVGARPAQDGRNGYFGLICRVQDDQNFYYFVIQNNGNYTIGKYKNAEFQSLLTGGWKPNQAIRPNTQTNRIQAECTANTLRLYINDVLLDEATDTDFASGFSGLLAASLDSQSFEVVFDHFLITEPE